VKVFTFFYNRYDTATTSRALHESGISHYVMIHNQQDCDKFVAGNTLHGQPVITNNPKGLAHQRNSALAMMQPGEWGAFLCDDFEKIMSFPPAWITGKTSRINITAENQNRFRLSNHMQMTLAQMFDLFPYLTGIAEKNGIHLIGFGLHDNPRNLARKFTTKGLADGRFWLVRKSTYEFDLNAQLIDDVAWTAENIVRHKKVMVLNWLVPYFKRYTAGGFGSTTERKERRRKECSYLVAKYAPLIRFAAKPGWDSGTHIKINASDKNIEIMRKRFGI